MLGLRNQIWQEYVLSSFIYAVQLCTVLQISEYKEMKV